MNVILSSAYGKVPGSAGLNVFLDSARRHAPSARVVLFFDGPKEHARAAQAKGAAVVPFRLNGDAQCKGRHAAYADFCLNELGPGDRVFTADARDTLFQGDPFDRGLDPDGLYLTEEWTRVGPCPWNSSDQRKFQASLRPQLRAADVSGWAVINGGFVTGPAREVGWLSAVRLAVDARDGPGTDQGALTALPHLLKLPASTLPWHYPLVFHGHWYAQSGLKTSGGVLKNPDGVVFAAVHQYDRCPDLQALNGARP